MSLGRLEAPVDRLRGEIQASDFLELPMEGHHALTAGSLPLHHSDPFDRMLIAQAQLEGCCLVTRDKAMEAYSVALISSDH